MTQPLTPAQNNLAERHMRLVPPIAKSVARKTRALFDDLLGPGRLGLVEAAARFEQTLGADFESFASFRIRGAMVDSVRQNLRGEPALRLAEASAGYRQAEDIVREGNPLEDGEEDYRRRFEGNTTMIHAAMFASTASVAWHADESDRGHYELYAKAVEALKAALAGLEPLQRSAIELLYLHQWTYASTMVHLKIKTPKSLRVLEQNALLRLGEKLRALGVDAPPASAR